MTSPAHADPNSTLLASEPVMAAAVATWVVTTVGTIVVSRYHLLTDGQWSAISVELTSLVSGLLLVGIGWLVRHRVTPVTKATAQAATAAPVVVLDNTPPATVEPFTPPADDPLTAALAAPAPDVTA